MKLSQGLRSTWLHSFPALFNGGAVFLYSNTRPEAPEDEPGASPVAVVSGGGLPYTLGSPTNGLMFEHHEGDVFVQAAPWPLWRLRGYANGTAVWCRLVGPTDNGGVSGDLPRVDFDVNSETPSGGLFLDDPEVTTDTNTYIQGWYYGIPPIPTGSEE